MNLSPSVIIWFMTRAAPGASCTLSTTIVSTSSPNFFSIASRPRSSCLAQPTSAIGEGVSRPSLTGSAWTRGAARRAHAPVSHANIRFIVVFSSVGRIVSSLCFSVDAAERAGRVAPDPATIHRTQCDGDDGGDVGDAGQKLRGHGHPDALDKKLADGGKSEQIGAGHDSPGAPGAEDDQGDDNPAAPCNEAVGPQGGRGD